MQCMKCGKETVHDQVFCLDCLAEMEAYPVPPGTPVIIPTRAVRNPTPRNREPSHEEQLRRLRRNIQRLWICVAVLVAALGISIGALIYVLSNQPGGPPIGQNYSTTEDVETTGG